MCWYLSHFSDTHILYSITIFVINVDAQIPFFCSAFFFFLLILLFFLLFLLTYLESINSLCRKELRICINLICTRSTLLFFIIISLLHWVLQAFEQPDSSICSQMSFSKNIMQFCGFCINLFSLKYINKKLLLEKVTSLNTPVLCSQSTWHHLCFRAKNLKHSL